MNNPTAEELTAKMEKNIEASWNKPSPNELGLGYALIGYRGKHRAPRFIFGQDDVWIVDSKPNKTRSRKYGELAKRIEDAGGRHESSSGYPMGGSALARYGQCEKHAPGYTVVHSFSGTTEATVKHFVEAVFGPGATMTRAESRAARSERARAQPAK